VQLRYLHWTSILTDALRGRLWRAGCCASQAIMARLSPAEGLKRRMEVTVVLSGRLPLSSLSSLLPGFEFKLV
jgi:hypothetical protein